MQSSLADSTSKCAQIFNDLLSLPRPQTEKKTHLLPEQIDDQAARFKIWAGNLGAFQQQSSKSSLDARLNESPEVVLQIHELLRDLHDALKDSRYIN